MIADFLRWLQFIDFRETSRPGWAGRSSRMRKARTPFKSSRKRAIAPLRMQLEEFDDKDERDARFAGLRSKGTPHVNKYSTVRANKSVWCVVFP